MNITSMAVKQGISMDRRQLKMVYLSGRLVLGLCLLVLVAACASSGGPGADTEPVLTPEQVQLNLDSFDMVWTTIRDKHWDPELGGVDWQAARDELRPMVAEATGMNQARSAMQDLIGRLGQSHFGIFPADAYADAALATGTGDDAAEGFGGTAGLDVRVRDGQVLVVGVRPDSPAAEAGIQPGWQVVMVKSDTLSRRVARLQETLPQNTSQGLLVSMAMQGRLKGAPGSTLPLVLRDGSGAEVALDLELVQERGALTSLGNMPPVRVWHESRTLADGIGYFGFNYFLGIMEVMPAFNEAMAGYCDSRSPARGMIIDLRGNPGGLGAMAMGMAGWFVDGKGHQLGTMTMRTGELNFAINPRPVSFQGPLAILTDEVSASTAEIMAGGLQDLGRARIFGCTTAGAALPSVIDKLPNGDGFQYAVANYESQGGRQLEGHGVAPDVEVPLSRESLLAEGDPVLKAAIAWIDSH